MKARDRRPRVYFSLRSPYSWLAYRRLVDGYPTLAAELEWLPFWEPDEQSLKSLAEAGGEFPYTPMSKAKHLYVLQDVRRLARRQGLTMAWPVDRKPWWEVPHLAYLVARRHGLGKEYLVHAHRARWEQREDICDRGTITKIAAELGLADAGLADAVDDPDVRAEGAEALQEVYRDGVFGVPFFVNGFEKFWGLDRLADFAASVHPGPTFTGTLPSCGNPAEGLRGAEAGGPAATFDDGHAGGCG